jgi:transcriptional regulator with XRE-family HTH domain
VPRTSLARVLSDLGLRVAELRRARDWTQEDLAVELGCHVRRVQRIESGSENLTVAYMHRIAESLGVAIVELLATPSDRQRRRPGRPRKLSKRA